MSNNIRLFTISTVIWGFIYALGLIHVTDPITRGTLLSVSPIMYAINRLKIEVRNEIAVVTEARILTNKYRALNEQNLQLRNEVALIPLLKEENSKLREQLGAPALDKFKLTPAKIVSKENGLSVVYDKNDSVVNGAIVVFRDNFVGKVIAHSNRAATIALVTDPTIQMPVKIINNEKQLIKGNSSGQFGTGITVERIEQSEKIEKGNIVVLDKSPGAPEGIVVGEITEVLKTESELFQRAKVSSFIEFDALDSIFIIQ
jgi:cell shape-determining protein MreC